MSRFRILVESLVESIYEEGLGIEEARLIALYEDAVTNGYIIPYICKEIYN